MWNKIQYNFNFDREFLSSRRITVPQKLNYLAGKYYGLATNSSKINFLGNSFRYDNPFTPVLLQGYPADIETLADAVDLNKVKTVLDVGANIGQWAFTFKSFFPKTKVFSLEPNLEAFKILTGNKCRFPNWDVYNFGIGNGAKHKFLYYKGRGSAEASVFKQVGDNAKQVPVKLITLDKRKAARYGLRDAFDLVKIDVEGAELEVLHAMKNISFKYLSVEIAITRTQGITVVDVENFFAKHTRRKAKLLTVQQALKNSPAGNAIFEIKSV